MKRIAVAGPKSKRLAEIEKQLDELNEERNKLSRECQKEGREQANQLNSEVDIKSLKKYDVYNWYVYVDWAGIIHEYWRIKGARRSKDNYTSRGDAQSVAKELSKPKKVTDCAAFKTDLKKLMRKYNVETT